MKSWIKKIGAIIAGVFAGGLTIALVESLGHAVVEGQTLFVIAALGLGCAAFVGGLVSRKISGLGYTAWIIAGTLACLSLVNVFSFAHPVWFVPVAFALLAVGAAASLRIGKTQELIA
ncbi:MAG: hypothetical protein AAFN07_02810 [Pseudomonadota bacterium]